MAIKEITRYRCPGCLTEYNEKAKAEKCEKSHQKPKKVMAVKYHSVYNDKSFFYQEVPEYSYPDTIDVLFGDGQTIRYKR